MFKVRNGRAHWGNSVHESEPSHIRRMKGCDLRSPTYHVINNQQTFQSTNDKIKPSSLLQETLPLVQIIDLLGLSGHACPLSGV